MIHHPFIYRHFCSNAPCGVEPRARGSRGTISGDFAYIAKFYLFPVLWLADSLRWLFGTYPRRRTLKWRAFRATIVITPTIALSPVVSSDRFGVSTNFASIIFVTVFSCYCCHFSALSNSYCFGLIHKARAGNRTRRAHPPGPGCLLYYNCPSREVFFFESQKQQLWSLSLIMPIAILAYHSRLIVGSINLISAFTSDCFFLCHFIALK